MGLTRMGICMIIQSDYPWNVHSKHKNGTKPWGSPWEGENVIWPYILTKPRVVLCRVLANTLKENWSAYVEHLIKASRKLILAMYITAPQHNHLLLFADNKCPPTLQFRPTVFLSYCPPPCSSVLLSLCLTVPPPCSKLLYCWCCMWSNHVCVSLQILESCVLCVCYTVSPVFSFVSCILCVVSLF